MAEVPSKLSVRITTTATRAFVTLILFTSLLLVLTPVLCWRTASALKARSPQAFTRGLAAVALGVLQSVYLIVFDPIWTFGEFLWAMPTLGQSPWQQVAPLLLAAFEALLLGADVSSRLVLTVHERFPVAGLEVDRDRLPGRAVTPGAVLAVVAPMQM